MRGVVAAKSAKRLPQAGHHWQYFSKVNAVRRNKSFTMNWNEVLLDITNQGYHLIDSR
ncbi:hypothetical protein [Aetokthonos hydrillicola]|nr:hypothetical protein [Aetokthonos hydrillicola]